MGPAYSLIVQFLNDTNLGNNVVLKPQSRNTLHWLQTSLLCVIPTVPRLSGDSPNFTDSLRQVIIFSIDISLYSQVPQGTAPTRNAKFVRLMRSLYKLTNSSSSLPVIPASLLRVQFIHLASDALLFLVGVWLSEEDAQLRRIALSHAFAFIAAYDSTETIIDFQTVLPALLVALGDSDRGVRHQASECVHLIARLSKAKQASGVYAFDAVYEKSTSKIPFVVMAIPALRGYNRSAQVPRLGRLPEIHRGDSDISGALRARF